MAASRSGNVQCPFLGAGPWTGASDGEDRHHAPHEGEDTLPLSVQLDDVMTVTKAFVKYPGLMLDTRLTL